MYVYLHDANKSSYYMILVLNMCITFLPNIVFDGKVSNLSIELNYLDNYHVNTLYKDNVVALYEGNDKFANI